MSEMRYPVNYIGIKQAFSSSHKGVDLGWNSNHGGKNQPIYACEDGTVIYKSYQSSGGYVIHIRHSNGYVSEYGHLKAGSLLVNKGDTVVKGQQIANMGATGRVTGEHLHFGMYRGTSINYNVNNWVDPINYVYAYNDQIVSAATERDYNILHYDSTSLLRSGMYGNYYGNLTTGSQPLSQSQMELNAQYIYRYLTHEGWSIEAICGLLGNMQYESTINPGRWQSDDVGNTSLGYGLVQWTPATKYINWVGSGNDYSTMDNNIARILYEVSNDIQYIATDSYPITTFQDYTLSELNPYYLACAFAWNYERSWVVLHGTEEQKEALRQARGGAANNWYEYLTGVDPGPGPRPPKKKHKFNFVLFERRRRLTNG